MIMDEKDKDLEAGTSILRERAAEKKSAVSRDRSPAGSTSTELEYDKTNNNTKSHRKEQQDPGKARADGADEASETDDAGSDHGVPDIDHEEAEEAVLGRDLDRQLSRVGLPRSVSPRECRRGSS